MEWINIQSAKFDLQIPLKIKMVAIFVTYESQFIEPEV